MSCTLDKLQLDNKLLLCSKPRLVQIMSDSIKNVAIFGATGMTGLATLPHAVAAGEETRTAVLCTNYRHCLVSEMSSFCNPRFFPAVLNVVS